MNELIESSDAPESDHRILWIGGATDAGKTTTARLFASKYDVSIWEYDREMNVPKRLGRERVPRCFEWAGMTNDERWLLRSPLATTQHVMAVFGEHFPSKLQKIRAASEDSVVLAEGFAFLPDFVAPVISSPRQAIWLVPTPTFKRESFDRRNKHRYFERFDISDPVRASHNRYEHDLLFAEAIKKQIAGTGLKLLEIDGTKTPEDVFRIVERHFAPFLPPPAGRFTNTVPTPHESGRQTPGV